MTKSVYVLDILRTPVGKLGGALASVRPDDLAAGVIKKLVERNPQLDVNQIEDVVFGAANQAGEDNRNVARMALLLAGLPKEVGGVTVNRLCASGLQAIMDATRAIAVRGEERAVQAMKRATSPQLYLPRDPIASLRDEDKALLAAFIKAT